MAATDDYANFLVPPAGPFRHAAAVTPGTALSDVSRALYVGGTGTLTAVMQDGSTVEFQGIPAGTILPICVSEVNSSGTTATLIVAMW